MSSATMDVSIEQLRQLPLEKRLAIIEALWESVEEELGPVPIRDDVLDEADREFEAHLADPSSSVPWEQVRAEMRRRLEDSAVEGSPGEMRLSQREQAEIDRRLAAHERDPGAARPVDAFLDELDRRYA
jgi:putative addiction module component (TIGR02574 family)